MTPERFSRICRVLDQRQPDLTIITDEVHKGRNLSAIVRTCDAVGIDSIHAVIPEDGYRDYRGTAAGAGKWVKVCEYDKVETPISALKAQGFTLLSADVGEDAQDFRSIDYTKPTALLLGAEIRGVSDAAQLSIDFKMSVPMMGMVESFNVSVACAIILMEAQRQRKAAGFYDHVRLSEKVYAQRFFSWAHPEVAAFCDRKGLAYPACDRYGEIVNPSRWLASIKTG